MMKNTKIGKLIKQHVEERNVRLNLTKVFSASEYTNMVTESSKYGDIEYYEDIGYALEENGLCLWDYSLLDIDEAIQNNDNLCLIYAKYKSDLINEPEIRLAEVPSDIDTKKY